jgi:hypothetical protein
LAEAGFRDFALFELEDVAGGNARGGANHVTAYPWGAHYLPVPNREAKALIHMLRQFGMITGQDAQGAPTYDPFQLCADLEERLLWRGKWQEGLVPTTGLSAQDSAQWRRFDAMMEAFRKAVGRDGRPAFASPSALSSRDEDFAALDGINFAAWLAGNGLLRRRCWPTCAIAAATIMAANRRRCRHGRAFIISPGAGAGPPMAWAIAN